MLSTSRMPNGSCCCHLHLFICPPHLYTVPPRRSCDLSPLPTHWRPPLRAPACTLTSKASRVRQTFGFPYPSRLMECADRVAFNGKKTASSQACRVHGAVVLGISCTLNSLPNPNIKKIPDCFPGKPCCLLWAETCFPHPPYILIGNNSYKLSLQQKNVYIVLSGQGLWPHWFPRGPSYKLESVFCLGF